MPKEYRRPYVESSVFISIIIDEKVPRRVTTYEDVEELRPNKNGDMVLQKRKKQKTETIQFDRARVATHVLELARSGVFKIQTSATTIAEVHKKKGSEPLSPEKNEQILSFFESEYLELIDANREICENANRFCVQYGITPFDAIHLASAIKVGCDVLLTWNMRGFGNIVKHPKISIEEPEMIGQGTLEFDTVA